MPHVPFLVDGELVFGPGVLQNQIDFQLTREQANAIEEYVQHNGVNLAVAADALGIKLIPLTQRGIDALKILFPDQFFEVSEREEEIAVDSEIAVALPEPTDPGGDLSGPGTEPVAPVVEEETPTILTDPPGDTICEEGMIWDAAALKCVPIPPLDVVQPVLQDPDQLTLDDPDLFRLITDIISWFTPTIVGPVGPTGEAGEEGPAGATGAAGVPGAAGAEGEAGVEGAAGVPGVSGAEGLVGAEGAAGVPGTTGAIGEAGVEGAAGVPGTTGAVGDTGETGLRGDSGLPGETGLTGQEGIPGERGLAGAIGDTPDLTGLINRLVGGFGADRPVAATPAGGGILGVPTPILIGAGIFAAILLLK